MVIKSIIGTTCVCLAVLSTSAQASVVESSDVMIGGTSYETFIDNTTGLTWLDLDNFWDTTSSYNTITTLLSGSGFHIANAGELIALQESIPTSTATFASEVIIIGGNFLGNPHPGLDRELMWGIYDDGNNASDGVSYSWRHDYDNGIPWLYGGFISDISILSSFNSTYQDLGAWVVEDSVVPVPAAVWLFGSGLIALIGLAGRKTT